MKNMTAYSLGMQATLLALGEVMGGSVGGDLASKIWASVGVEIAPHIENKFNYKQFAGIAAITERIFCWNFCKGEEAGPTAPKVQLPVFLRAIGGRIGNTNKVGFNKLF